MEFQGFTVKEQRRFTKKEVVDKLYETLPTVEEFYSTKTPPNNKYIHLALKYNLSNYKIGTLADIYSLGLMESFTLNQREFFNNVGEFIVMFNTLNNKPISIVMRGIKEKIFVDFSIFYTVYGLDHINPDFKYGDWLLLTEGIYDADSFRPIFQDSLALLTSNITIMQSEVLSTLTNRFIMAFDNDDGGIQGAKRSTKRLVEVNKVNIVKSLPIFSRDNDLGDLEDIHLGTPRYDRAKKFYTNWVTSITREVGI